MWIGQRDIVHLELGEKTTLKSDKDMPLYPPTLTVFARLLFCFIQASYAHHQGLGYVQMLLSRRVFQGAAVTPHPQQTQTHLEKLMIWNKQNNWEKNINEMKQTALASTKHCSRKWNINSNNNLTLSVPWSYNFNSFFMKNIT